MPQSLSFILIHINFSTKGRLPNLDAAIRPALYAYLATVIRHAGCECFRVGGVADHVHFAVRFTRTDNIANLVGKLKSASTRWLKLQAPALADFAWQRGYAAFSLGSSEAARLIHYIDNQETHHETRTFKDEYRTFLTKYDVAFDERYVWD